MRQSLDNDATIIRKRRDGYPKTTRQSSDNNKTIIRKRRDSHQTTTRQSLENDATVSSGPASLSSSSSVGMQSLWTIHPSRQPTLASAEGAGDATHYERAPFSSGTSDGWPQCFHSEKSDVLRQVHGFLWLIRIRSCIISEIPWHSQISAKNRSRNPSGDSQKYRNFPWKWKPWFGLVTAATHCWLSVVNIQHSSPQPRSQHSRKSCVRVYFANAHNVIPGHSIDIHTDISGLLTRQGVINSLWTQSYHEYRLIVRTDLSWLIVSTDSSWVQTYRELRLIVSTDLSRVQAYREYRFTWLIVGTDLSWLIVSIDLSWLIVGTDLRDLSWVQIYHKHRLFVSADIVWVQIYLMRTYVWEDVTDWLGADDKNVALERPVSAPLVLYE